MSLARGTVGVGLQGDRVICQFRGTSLQSQLAKAQALLLLKGTVHFRIVKYMFEVVFGLLDLAAGEMSAVFQICWS